MKGKMNAKMGNIIIDRDVLAKYAGAATAECIGIVGMAVNVKRWRDQAPKERECRTRCECICCGQPYQSGTSYYCSIWCKYPRSCSKRA